MDGGPKNGTSISLWLFFFVHIYIYICVASRLFFVSCLRLQNCDLRFAHGLYVHLLWSSMYLLGSSYFACTVCSWCVSPMLNHEASAF